MKWAIARHRSPKFCASSANRFRIRSPPLSDNPDFNRVVFPARAIEGVEGEFSVLIFNINGVLIRELKSADPGVRDLEWDGKDELGDFVESGVYVYQIQVDESFDTGTVIVAK